MVEVNTEVDTEGGTEFRKEKMGVGRGKGSGVSLVPAMTSSFIWSVNSGRGDEGERVTKRRGGVTWMGFGVVKRMNPYR